MFLLSQSTKRTLYWDPIESSWLRGIICLTQKEHESESSTWQYRPGPISNLDETNSTAFSYRSPSRFYSKQHEASEENAPKWKILKLKFSSLFSLFFEAGWSCFEFEIFRAFFSNLILAYKLKTRRQKKVWITFRARYNESHFTGAFGRLRLGTGRTS